jgi:hypothetical protein
MAEYECNENETINTRDNSSMTNINVVQQCNSMKHMYFLTTNIF